MMMMMINDDDDDDEDEETSSLIWIENFWIHEVQTNLRIVDYCGLNIGNVSCQTDSIQPFEHPLKRVSEVGRSILSLFQALTGGLAWWQSDHMGYQTCRLLSIGHQQGTIIYNVQSIYRYL